MNVTFSFLFRNTIKVIKQNQEEIELENVYLKKSPTMSPYLGELASSLTLENFWLKCQEHTASTIFLWQRSMYQHIFYFFFFYNFPRFTFSFFLTKRKYTSCRKDCKISTSPRHLERNKNYLHQSRSVEKGTSLACCGGRSPFFSWWREKIRWVDMIYDS